MDSIRSKLKGGNSLADDLRHCRVSREVLGPDVALPVDADQVSDVPATGDWTRSLEQFGLLGSRSPPVPTTFGALPPFGALSRPVPVTTGQHRVDRPSARKSCSASKCQGVTTSRFRRRGIPWR
jgi:L-fuconate dehydratase